MRSLLKWSHPVIRGTPLGDEYYRIAPLTNDFQNYYMFHREKCRDLNLTKKHVVQNLSRKQFLYLMEKKSVLEGKKVRFKNLYDWQQDSANELLRGLHVNNAFLDGSDTGTGKTYKAVAVIKHLCRFPIVVCPLTVISTWENVFKIFGVTNYYVNNYEQFRTGNTPYLTFDRARRSFTWTLAKGCMVIFDEAHRVKGLDTLNSRMAMACKIQKIMTLLISATLADSPLHLRAAGFLLNLHDNKKYWQWCRERGCFTGEYGMRFNRSNKVMRDLHHNIYGSGKGTRIKISELPKGTFPETTILCEAVLSDKEKELQLAYMEMKDKISVLEAKEKHNLSSQEFGVQQRFRQKIELLKCPTFVRLVEDAVSEGNYVCLFLNFIESIKWCAARLKCQHTIYGDTEKEDRDKAVKLFQTNQINLLILNSFVGGVGISLHSLDKTKQRLSIISPTWDATVLKQVFGRVWRDGGGYSLQRIIYAKNTIEEDIMKQTQAKLNNIDSLNDGDLGLNWNFFKKTPKM